MDRTFYIETPIGKLKVWAKHETDSAADYPGVYIDFIPYGFNDTGNDDDKNMVAVVEYDPFNKCIQTLVFQPSKDEPIAVIERDKE